MTKRKARERDVVVVLTVRGVVWHAARKRRGGGEEGSLAKVWLRVVLERSFYG